MKNEALTVPETPNASILSHHYFTATYDVYSSQFTHYPRPCWMCLALGKASLSES